MTNRESSLLYTISDLKELYLHGDPYQKEKANNWLISIGLQQVDGMNVSSFLIELAVLNTKGEISYEEIDKRLKDHYATKNSSITEKTSEEAFSGYTIIDCGSNKIKNKRYKAITRGSENDKK